MIKSCTEGDQLSALWIDSSCERHWDLVTIHRHDFQKKIQAQRQSENLLLYPEIESVPARPGSWRWLSSWGSGTHSGGHRDSGGSRGHRGVLRKLPADSSLWPAAPRELPGLLRHWLTHIMSHISCHTSPAPNTEHQSGHNLICQHESHFHKQFSQLFLFNSQLCPILTLTGVRMLTSWLGSELPYSLILISMLIWSVTLNFTSQEHKHNILLSVFTRDHEPPDPWAGLWLAEPLSSLPSVRKLGSRKLRAEPL